MTNQAQALIAAGFDIDNMGKFDPAATTFKVPVLEDADGEPLTGFIIVGKNSSQYQDANNTVRVGNIQRSSKRSKQVDASTVEGAEIVSRTVAANERTVALAVVVGWFGFNKNGEAMAFDKQTVEDLFDRFPQWQVKVNLALDNDANFMKV